MKLRKQAPAKVAIVAASAGLLLAFYSVVKAEPRIKAEGQETPPPVDYQRFFAPSAPSGASLPPAIPVRTRAS